MIIYLPEHVNPVPINPFLQVHVYDPSVFVQLAFVSHRLFPSHSMMSERQLLTCVKYMECEVCDLLCMLRVNIHAYPLTHAYTHYYYGSHEILKHFIYNMLF